MTTPTPRIIRSLALATLAFTLAASGTVQAVDAYLTTTSQIRSASNNPYFGAGLTQNTAAVNLTWYGPLTMAFGVDRENPNGKLAGGTLNGIGFHDILLGNGADTATGVAVSNALTGVTVDYTLSGGINRNFPAAIYTGTDAAVLYNISATNVCRNSHSVITFHGLTPNNNLYVQLIGGNLWKVPVAVSLNGATPVNWTSQAACKDPGQVGVQDGTNNSALLGLATTADAAGNLTIDVYSTGGNGYHGLGAITVAQQLVRAGPLHHFEVTVTSTQTTGSAFSATVTAMDVAGKTLTYDSSTLVTMTSSSGNAQFDSDANGTFDDNTKTLSDGTFTIMTKDNVAESVTLTASAGSKTGTSQGITVLLPLQAETVTFGTGANQFALTFNPASAAYRVGNTEVPNDAFNKFYLTTKGVACAGNAGLPLTDAACNVSGIAAVDFINWLNTSSGLPAAYTFNADHTALLNWNRTPGAKFFLPTVAEWNGALASISYAFGPCIYEWIQDAAGAGGNLDGVENWRANKSFDESSFVQVYEDTGFRVMSDSSVGLTIRNPFDAWIAGAPLTGFSDDPNHDGVANGLAWLLNGSAMGNSRECLPLGATAAGKLVLSFQCLKASARGTAVLNVQYSNDLGVLDAWHSAAVPEVTSAVGGISFTVTPITASDYQTISAEIPLSAASSDGKLFGRLLGTQ